jgi:hypothetical protein
MMPRRPAPMLPPGNIRHIPTRRSSDNRVQTGLRSSGTGFERAYVVKRVGLLILGLLATGCAHIPKTGNPVVYTPPIYTPATAAALAFDPPITLAGPMVDLSREGRENQAFVGYEQMTVESSYVYQRDQQRGPRFDGDRFDRIAYSARQTVISR